MNFKPIHPLAHFLLVACLLGGSLAGCAGAPAPASPTAVPTIVPALTEESGPYWPTQEWRSSSPEEQGMDSAKLEEMFDAIEEKQLDLDALLVIRNGYVVSERYFKTGPGSKHELYSCTKSFASTLVGIAM